ncbi:hypothetical protein F5Y05DRAFT_354233 [Hypoxylon sp. FL0543]|nr:hypothetical protein F5Y05DRAFT_354233 [Hypoxylon sp. FL0543]
MAAGEFSVLGIEHIIDPKHLAFILYYIYNGKEFGILVADDPPPGYDKEPAIEKGYLRQLDDLSAHDSTNRELLDRQAKCVEQLSHEIGKIALPTFQKLAPSPSVQPLVEPQNEETHTVQEYLYPEDVVKLQLATLDGHLTIIEGHQTKAEAANKPITCDELGDIGADLKSLPTFPASQVYIGPRYKTGISAFEASVEGEEGEQYVCKIALSFLRDTIISELKALVKIEKANFDSEVRTSRLKGLITHGDGYVGFLMEKIPTRFASLDPLIEGQEGEVPLPLRRMWAAQIEYTVAELHKNNIIWKDAKPDNVIIDWNYCAWLIDFGGGFTEPWVDEELYESQEGDLQALRKIRERLEQGIQSNGEDGKCQCGAGQVCC